MPILTIVLLITVMLTAICLLLPLMDKKHRRKKAGRLFRLLSQAGSKHHLSFSSQDMINGNVMGLDGVHRQLMILSKKTDGTYKEIIINLNDVKACSVVKAYGTIPVEESINRLPEAQLQKIALHFVFANNKIPLEIDFYDPFANTAHQHIILLQKMKDWETILSKMLREPLYAFKEVKKK